MAFYQDTVDLLRPGVKVNRAQEQVLDYSGLRDIPGTPRSRVQVRPVTQAEVDGQPDRSSAITGWKIATAPESGDWDVRSTDWVRLPDGTVCTVQGRPAKPSDPISGGLHHVEVLVRAVTEQ